jgi:RNA polymerase sigma factor (sigma-70 family)
MPLENVNVRSEPRPAQAPPAKGRAGIRKLASAEKDAEVTALVQAARDGDRGAWEGLFNRYVGLLWSVALRHGLHESDAADVVQNTWLRLLEHIDGIRDPARVGAWLATTAQRESLRCVAQNARLVLSNDETTFDGADRLLAPVDEGLLAREQAKAALAALASLPPTWRSLVERLTQDPPLSYEEIGSDLGVPVGTIGPTRGRCVRRMRAIVDAN